MRTLALLQEVPPARDRGREVNSPEGTTNPQEHMATNLTEPTRILIADDDAAIRRMLQRVLEKAGHEVVCVDDGKKALTAFAEQDFHLVLTDLGMPKLGGLELLTTIRKQDADVPVIVFTGSPDAASAIDAVNLDATKYLAKPLSPDRIRAEVEDALTLGRMARARREARGATSRPPPIVSERAIPNDLPGRFDNALKELHMAYQPIVHWPQRTVFGFEGLVRTREKSIPHPGALFDAAERLERLPDLSRRIRTVVGDPIIDQAVTSALFVNLHARDLLDEGLYAPDAPLAKMAEQVVFEITERANLDAVSDLEQRVSRLRELGYRIAVDDIGAGYSGLNSFALLRPDIVKLDLSLVRNVDQDPLKQRLVRMICELSTELGISVVGEGVETVGERDALLGLGCDLLQGYLLARPGPPFPTPDFDA